MTEEIDDEARPAHFVQSLERGLAVIKAFTADDPSLSLTEVARKSGLTRAAARRFLLTLVDLGYTRVDGRSFSLTPRVLELGYAYLSSFSLTQVAEPHMEELVAQVRESCSVSVLDGTDIVYIARIPMSRIMTVSINVGTRFPAHATSMGRVLLSALDEPHIEDYIAHAEFVKYASHTNTDPDALRTELIRVRRQGWSIVDQELEEGLRSVAAPIRDSSGRVVASANVSSHASRASLTQIKQRMLPLLLDAVARIEADLRVGPSRSNDRS
jgi:IclR family pca regulon transcriptional regulator